MKTMLNKMALTLLLASGPVGCAAIFGLEGDPVVATDASPGQPDGRSDARPSPDAAQLCSFDFNCADDFECNELLGQCVPIGPGMPDAGFPSSPDGGTSPIDAGASTSPDASF